MQLNFTDEGESVSSPRAGRTTDLSLVYKYCVWSTRSGGIRRGRGYLERVEERSDVKKKLGSPAADNRDRRRRLDAAVREDAALR